VTNINSLAIILVHSQLGENMGMAARAMHNCGLTDLRLVSPRQDWLSEKAIAASAGGANVLKGASFYESTEQAIADLHFVGAATARPRDIVKPVETPRQFTTALFDEKKLTIKTGCLFGREKSGLRNHDISLADVIVEVPLNPDYSSLNLAQAVLLIAYEWYQLYAKLKVRPGGVERFLPATKGQLDIFFQHLEGELD
jgi:tRNA/rRNA methyltransferase